MTSGFVEDSPPATVTREFAAKHGLEVDPELGESNPDYVGYRLFLLLTDSTSELVAGSSRWLLLLRYIAARWAFDWPWKRRLLAVGLALAATVSPAPLATLLLTWLHDPQSRPGWWRHVALHRRRA